MESRRGPKFRKKKKKKGDEITLAERIMLKREAAAQEAERNSNKSQGSSSLENNSESKPVPRATTKDLSEAANTPGSDGRLSSSESVDISHITKDSDQKKRTPTPEPTLSASHSDQLASPSSAETPPQKNPNHSDRFPPDTSSAQKSSPSSLAQNTDNIDADNNVQPSYQQPLHPAYTPYLPENSISNQSKSSQQSQHQQEQILQPISTSTASQKQSGFQSEVGRSIPVTSNYITTCAVTTVITSSSSPDTTITHTNPSFIPLGGHETKPTHQQSHPLAQPQITNSDFNQYMSLAQKIILQRKIVAVCDSVIRQQPQPYAVSSKETPSTTSEDDKLSERQVQNMAPEAQVSGQESCLQQPRSNPGFEANAVITTETPSSTINENNPLSEQLEQNMAPEAQVSCQEPCPLSDNKCPIHSTTVNNRESNEHGNLILPNLNEYKGSTSDGQTTQFVNSQASSAVETALLTESIEADQTVKPSDQTKNQQSVSRNGFLAQNPQEINMLPTDPKNEDLDLVDHFELEALEKMVDHDLQSLVSGNNTEENTPVINKDLKNKVLSEEFQRKIDRFLNDI